MQLLHKNEVLHVYVVERNPLASWYLLELLQKDPQIRACDLDDVSVAAGGGNLPPIFVIDSPELSLPLSDCLRRIRADQPLARFLVLDYGEELENILHLLWLGVTGFLAYRNVSQTLISALHSIASGRMWVPRSILSEYVQRSRGISRNSYHGGETLTLRESQIIDLARQRLSNKEIASILSIRESTVKFHFSNIFSKLHVSSRHALIQHHENSGNQSRNAARSPLPMARSTTMNNISGRSRTNMKLT